MEKRLNIAFFWHMHQPVYKDPLTDEYVLPWVLLHGTKDYYDMAAILEEFPSIHQTFNLVPSLIRQLEDYTSEDVKDRYRAVSLKDAESLTRDERLFMLERFFQSNWDTMIRPLGRYWELLKKRGFSTTAGELETALRYFSDQDFRDLQVLFNLAWIDPMLKDRDPFLASLAAKGKGFSEDEKRRLLAKQIEIIRMIIPEYRKLKDQGTIELTTSPFYHPILPLLCDHRSAREAMPGVKLPSKGFSHPEDALEQIRKGIRLHSETFGDRPRGMWPPEGSVSTDILPMIREQGIEWIATDEEILSHSLGIPVRRDPEGHSMDTTLYRAYSIEADGGPLRVIFRDKVLSDLIGFEYARWGAESAVDDFISRLSVIYDLTAGDPDSHLVSIILDGENAWEYYRNDGRDFLSALYSRLEDDGRFRCVTVSEFLSDLNPSAVGNLKRLYSGSWINHNFKIWIGHVEDNTAWDHISETREVLCEYQLTAGSTHVDEQRLREAWDAIYASEGSDWFWWYGDEHATMSEHDFDNLFRSHLKKVYTLIGRDYPPVLDIPIISEERGYRPARIPTGFITPVFDGEITNYFEWLGAGRLERINISGAMHGEGEPKGLLDGISYGFNLERIFFRLDYLKELTPYPERWSFTINFLHPRPMKAVIHVEGRNSSGRLLERTNGGTGWTEKGAIEELASNDVVEIGIPFESLGAKGGDELRLFIDVDAIEKGFERWPARGFLIVDVPTEDFELHHWMV